MKSIRVFAVCVAMISVSLSLRAQLPSDCAVKGPFGDYCVVIEKAGKFGIMSMDSVVLVAPRYDEIEKVGVIHPQWSRVRVGTKFGLVDQEGWEMIKPQFDEIYPFGQVHPGLALVRIKSKYGCIGVETADLVMSVKYDEVGKLGETLPRIMVVRKGKLLGGFVPEEFYFAIPVNYESLRAEGTADSQLIIAMKGGKYALLDAYGFGSRKLNYDNLVWDAPNARFVATAKGVTYYMDASGEDMDPEELSPGN